VWCGFRCEDVGRGTILRPFAEFRERLSCRNLREFFVVSSASGVILSIEGFSEDAIVGSKCVIEQIRRLAAPDRLCGAREFEALAAENVLDTVEREVLGKFARCDIGQQTGSG
jgi:hypothetical protein